VSSLGLAASIGLPSIDSQLTVPKWRCFPLAMNWSCLGTVEPHHLPTGAIFNSNRFFLRSLLERLGCLVTDLGNVPDDPEKTFQALSDAALDHDLILTSGGVSVGEADFVKPAVQSLGELQLWSLSIKPGKPFAYGYMSTINPTQINRHTLLASRQPSVEFGDFLDASQTLSFVPSRLCWI
jgi:molybdopterin molybdotransferase